MLLKERHSLKVEVVEDSERAGVNFEDNVFASPGYLAAKSSSYGWLVSNNYALPFYVDKILVFRRLVFTSAPICRCSDKGEPPDEKAFLDAAIDALDRHNLCDFISKPQSNAVFDVAPRRGVYCPWGTYETRIDRSDTALLEAFHAKHRNVIKKAIREGVVVRVMENLEVVQDNIRSTLLRQRLPYYPSLKFVKQLCVQLPSSVLILGAYYRGKLQGVALVPFDSQCGYYLYGGSIDNPFGG
jgi:hypothetical protein